VPSHGVPCSHNAEEEFPQIVRLRASAGSTGDAPVSPGESPDEMAGTPQINKSAHFANPLSAVPVGGSPTGAGGSPALPTARPSTWHRVHSLRRGAKTKAQRS